MKRDIIDQALYDNGIRKFYCNFIDDINGIMTGANIIINSDIKNTYKDNSTTWHEFFHVITCPHNLVEAPSGIQDKFEHLAERKAAEQCIPLDTIIELHEYGADSLEDFAEALELDMEYIYRTMQQYQSRYGYRYRHGDYVFESFLPLHIKNI